MVVAVEVEVVEMLAHNNDNMHRDCERECYCENQDKKMPVYSARVVNEYWCVFFNVTVPFVVFCAGCLLARGVKRGHSAGK